MSGRHKRLSAEERRASILEASLPLFAEQGFRGTTTKQLAEAAGVSEALLYKHFPSKEAIYGELLSYCSRSDDEALEIGQKLVASTETLVLAIYYTFFSLFYGERGLAVDRDTLLRLMSFSLLEDGKFAGQMLDNFSTKFLPRILESIEAAYEAGDLVEKPKDRGAKMWLCHHMAFAMGLFALNPVVRHSLSRDDLFDETVKFALRGVGLTEKAIATYYRPESLHFFARMLAQAFNKG